LRFLENNRELLETAELGLFAVVPPDPELPVSQPGILFCLRQRDNKRPTEVNPLAPYYLVYVLDDGNVRLTFMQPKQALELFRALASNHTSAFNHLCDAFDGRNDNGTDMTHESALLDSAVPPARSCQVATACFQWLPKPPPRPMIWNSSPGSSSKGAEKGAQAFN